MFPKAVAVVSFCLVQKMYCTPFQPSLNSNQCVVISLIIIYVLCAPMQYAAYKPQLWIHRCHTSHIYLIICLNMLFHDLKLKICSKNIFNMLLYIIHKAIQLILIVYCALNAVNVYLQGAYNTI